MFDPGAYGEGVRALLALGDNGARLLPLVFASSASAIAPETLRRASAQDLFGRSAAPREALGGLWVYFEDFDRAHGIVQDLSSAEASYWHAIVHRREPDPGNASYWFRRVGDHPIFPLLGQGALELQERQGKRWLVAGPRWNPNAFTDLTEEARSIPGSEKEVFARQVQLLEWQLLFDYCAKEK
jgi:hypothetical protein